MHDVARAAGVGIGTVSRVLNDSPHVSVETRARVRAAMEETGYQPTRRNRRNQGQHHRLVGVLVPFFGEASPFMRLRGIVHRLARHHGEAVILNVESPAEARARLVELPNNTMLDGLIVISMPLQHDEGRQLARAPFPTVLVDTIDPALPSVHIDDRAGGAMATRHLLSLGHRRIAFVGEQPGNQFGFVASAHREEGFRRMMAEAGQPVPPELVRYGAFLHTAARRIARDLLSLDQPPTAIVAGSDTQAFGCLDAARQLGVRVPEDLSIIGYDDIDLAALMGLTTVRQPLVYSGERAAELVVESMSMRPAEPSSEQLELELVVRGTTAPPRSGS
ncbi:MAG: LacI family DNA-binding transcriptional regulator [Acidimicrobiales bacterium]